MGLFSTIQQSAGALQTAQVGLQVVGNNIANANTPGYIRQQLQQASSVTVRDGNLIKGLGVRATGITQAIDDALVERMFSAKTSLVGSETLGKAYAQLEEITTDLDNTGLGNQLSQFNNSLHELSAQPGDSSLRDFVVIQGDTLATNVRRLRNEALARRELWNEDLDQMTDEINRLTGRVAQLNLEIATMEGGGTSGSDATGLRDQRLRDLEDLSEILSINIQEQPNGSISVFVGGDYLVSGSNAREVYTAYSNKSRGNEVRIIETDSPLQVTAGKLASTMIARDTVFDEYVDSLDEVASALIRSVNEVHSQGQGRKGYRELLSSSTSDAGVPLDEAGLPWAPRNGTFDMSVVDAEGQVISNHRIAVRMLDRVTDSTVSSIVADIDAIEGISAKVTREGQVEILSDSPAARFTFGEDTSGFLAAMGINTFFKGRSGVDIAVNDYLKEDASFLAVSAGGINEDTDVLTELVDIVDRPSEHLKDRSVRDAYEDTISALSQKISLQESETEGLSSFHATLQGQHLAITGVNIDEESIRMMTYQRAFQASSRVIATASELLELLVTL